MNSNIKKTMSFNEYSVVLKGIINNIVENKNFICKKIYYDNNVYYSTYDIFKFLKYDNNQNRISDILDHVRSEDKFTLKQLKQNHYISSQPHNGICCFDPYRDLITKIGKEENTHIFVNTRGFYYILGNSNNAEVQPFVDFIYYELLPSLDKKYKDIIYSPEENIKKILNDLKDIKNENKEVKTALNNIIGIEKSIKDLQFELNNQIKLLHDIVNLLDKKEIKISKLLN